jgi:hypothetical protein
VPFYEAENKWNVEIYDTKGQLLFPNSNEELKPEHFVPRLSSAAAVIQCGGIWIGGKGWGVTWKLVQAVVKPKITESVFGKCHIQLSDEEQVAMETTDPDAIDAPEAVAPAAELKAISTEVADSDEEDAIGSASGSAVAHGSAVAQAQAQAPVAKTIVKKVPAAPTPTPIPAPASVEEPSTPGSAVAQAPAPKKIIKKTVTKA